MINSYKLQNQTNKIKRLTWNHSITDPEGALEPCKTKQNKENTNLCLVLTKFLDVNHPKTDSDCQLSLDCELV